MTEQIPDSPLSDLGGGLSDAWSCGVQAWSAYMTDLVNARGVDDLLSAQTRLVMNSFDVFGQAAGKMLQRHGLTSPTLNEP